MCPKIDVMERVCKNYNIWGASKQALVAATQLLNSSCSTADRPHQPRSSKILFSLEKTIQFFLLFFILIKKMSYGLLGSCGGRRRGGLVFRRGPAVEHEIIACPYGGDRSDPSSTSSPPRPIGRALWPGRLATPALPSACAPPADPRAPRPRDPTCLRPPNPARGRTGTSTSTRAAHIPVTTIAMASNHA
jgi:hypothetical protein